MGIFNRAIPKYIRNPIDNSISVEPVTESVQTPDTEPVALVDDAFDPLFNRAVRDRLMQIHGDPFSATLGGYAELLETAFTGNKELGGNVQPGVGILSSFGRTMDKAGDVVLGSLTEGVKGLTGQGMENPFYNILTEDQDYSGQRFLAAAANSMAKLAGTPELTEADFGGVWTIPALSIDLMTDPSILGGSLTKIAKGQGAVSEAGRLLQEYDDIMSRVAIDATAPGLRPLGKKFGAKLNSYISNLSTEKELQDAILWARETLDKTVVDLNIGTMSSEDFDGLIQRVGKVVEAYQKNADQDVIAKPLKEMADEVETATGNIPAPNSFEEFLNTVKEYNKQAEIIKHSKIVSKTLDEDLDTVTKLKAELVDFITKSVGKRKIEEFPFLNEYHTNPEAFLDDFKINKAYLDTSDSTKNYTHMRSKDEVEYEFLQKLPESFTEKYSIASREDFLNLLKSDLTTEQSAEINSLLNSMSRDPKISTRGRVKISQSASKLPVRTQLFINNEQQRIVSSIITEAVSLGLVEPKNISEDTLNDLFNNLYSFMRSYDTSSTDTLRHRFNALNHYRFNAFDYLANKISNTVIKPVWNDSVIKDNLIRDNMRSNWKSADSYARYLTSKLSRDFDDLQAELDKLTSAGVLDTSPEYAKLIEDFMNSEVEPAIKFSKKDLVTEIFKDERSSNIKFSKKNRFPKLSSRDQVRTSDASKEFGEISKLVRDYTQYVKKRVDLGEAPGLAPKVPTVYKHADLYYSKHMKDPSFRRTVAKYVAEASDSAKKWDKLMQYIQKEIVQYEQNIGSKIGGRYFADGLEGLKDIGKTTADSSLGISKAINDAIANIDFKSPIEVYEFMKTPIKTSKGYFSLSDLGFEVTQLPEEMLKPIRERTVKAFNTPVHIGKRTTTLQDLISEQMLKYKSKIHKEWGGVTISNESDVAKYIISEDSYNKYVKDTVHMSWDEFVRRCTFIDVSKLVYDDKAFKVLRNASNIADVNDLMESIEELTKRVRTRGGMLKKYREAGIPLHIRKEHSTKKYPTILESLRAMHNLMTKEYAILSLETAGVPAKYLEDARKIDMLNGGSLDAILDSVHYNRTKDIIFEKITDPDIYLKSWLNEFKFAKTNKAYQFLNRLNPKLGKMSVKQYDDFLKTYGKKYQLFNTLKQFTFDIRDSDTFEVLKYVKDIDPNVKILDVESVYDTLRANLDVDEYSEAISKLKTIPLDPESFTVNGVFPSHIDDLRKISDNAVEVSAEKTVEQLPDEAFEQIVTNQWKIYQESDFEKRAEMINEMFPDQTPITAAELKLYEEYGGGGKTPVTRTIREVHRKQIRLYDLLGKAFRQSLKARQDRDSVLSLPKMEKLLSRSTELQEISDEADVTKVLTLLDKQRGSTVKGSDFILDLVLSNGHKIIAFEDDKITSEVKALANTIKKNIDAVNKAAGGEVIVPIKVVNTFGQLEIGYQLTGNQKLFKNLSKNYQSLKLDDVIFEAASALTEEELKFLTKYQPVLDHLREVQEEASNYYTKLGFNYSDPGFFKHTFKNTPGWQEFVSEHYYKGIDTDTSEQLAEMCINLGYFGDLRGQFGALPNSRIFEGNIGRYNNMFDTNLNSITKSTFTKGIFANEKFQTTLSLFDNNEFRLNTYCQNIDDVRNILNSQANRTNLTIASVKYNEDGMITGFTKYDNFSDASLNKALKDEGAIFLPTHIFATLDKFCKQRARMSNKAYAFINRYLTAPFKIGVLLNPGFLLGNVSDAYLKQATTMSKKYGTTIAEELTNVASSIRTTIYLNNKFTDIYDTYLQDLINYGVKIPANYKMSLQVSKSKAARDMFVKYLNGNLQYGYDKTSKTKLFITPSLTDSDKSLSQVWIHLNAIQPTEGVTKELAGDLLNKSTGKLNYAKNPIDRILYGLYHYDGKDMETYGLLNHPGTKTVFGMSEATESLARSSAILNDLAHQGIDLTEFGKELGVPNNTEFNVKMLNAINAMHNANFDYNSTAPLLEGLEGFVPFPTFWLKNLSYWFDMFINHPQYIDAALDINEGLWANEDAENDEFKADAKSRGAIPLSATGGQNLSNFFRGIYKPSPLQSMFTAFNTLNNPVQTTFQRTNPLIQGAVSVVGTEPMFDNLTTYLQDPEDMRYRPYNDNQYQPNIKASDEEFNPIEYTAHKLNPFDRTINTALRTPGKVRKGEAQLSDFLPSVFQPDFGKK